MDNRARKQIIIPAVQQPETVKLKVAAYCRVSSDSTDQLNSFAAQNTYYTTLITSTDSWELVDIYADEGITGTSAAKRMDFQRLMTDCRAGRIDKVLTKSISRFARNTRECLEAVRELKSLGIGIYFEEQNIDTKTATSEMLTAIMAAVAEQESESSSKNTRLAIERRMAAGTFISGKNPLGLKNTDKKPVIQAEEAFYARYIGSEYLKGRSTTDIAAEMLERSATEPILRKYKWTYKTVIYLLKNEKLVGDTLLQKTYRTTTLPRKRFNNHGERPQYYIYNSHQGIFDRQTFNAIQNLLS